MEGLPEGWIEARVGGALILARRESLDIVRPLIQRAGTLHAAAQGETLTGGRGGARVLSMPDADWVVRPYRRGGAMRWLHDRYLRSAEPRPIHEIRASETARGRAIDTPRVMAAGIYEAGPFHRADIATERIHSAEELARLTFGPAPWPEEEISAAWSAAGRLVREALVKGVIHADLHPGNILIARNDSGLRAWLLDLDRARTPEHANTAERARVVARFERSIAKHEQRAGRGLHAGARAAFDAALSGGR
jgi:3-deoxy-D-manno-octulosonic acid kinase